MTAKSRVWKGLSEELKNELTLAAETKKKKTATTALRLKKLLLLRLLISPKLSLRNSSSALSRNSKTKPDSQTTSFAAPEREPPKPRKSKKDKNEEQDSNSDTKSEKSLTEMVKSIQIGDDSDSDDDEPQEHGHNQILWAINIVKSDTSLKEEMKDFHAWIY